jgi:hypothetical protein
MGAIADRVERIQAWATSDFFERGRYDGHWWGAYERRVVAHVGSRSHDQLFQANIHGVTNNRQRTLIIE